MEDPTTLMIDDGDGGRSVALASDDGRADRGAALVEERRAGGRSSFRFILTTESVDAHGSVIRRDGLDFTRYRAHPIVLLDHENSVDSIAGRAVNIENIDEDGLRGVALDVEFDTKDSPRVQRAERLARAKLLGMSIGFRGKKVRFGDAVSRTERDLLGLPPDGFIVDEGEVMEASLVGVPSNRDTLQRLLGSDDATGRAIDDEPASEPEAQETPAGGADEDTLAAIRSGLAELATGQGAIMPRVVEALDEAVADIRSQIENELRAVVSAIARVEAGLTDIASGRAAKRDELVRTMEGQLRQARRAVQRAGVRDGAAPDAR